MPSEPSMEECIARMVDDNYPTLLGFDLSEGKLTFKEYMEKIHEWRIKREKQTSPKFQRGM